jgi:hypothetical protein
MKKLLIKLRDEVQRPTWSHNGICATATSIWWKPNYVNNQEYRAVDEYLKNNLPQEKNAGYCWPPGEKEPRIKWLNEQIAKFEGEKKSNFWTKIKGIFMPKK